MDLALNNKHERNTMHTTEIEHTTSFKPELQIPDQVELLDLNDYDSRSPELNYGDTIDDGRFLIVEAIHSKPKRVDPLHNMYQEPVREKQKALNKKSTEQTKNVSKAEVYMAHDTLTDEEVVVKIYYETDEASRRQADTELSLHAEMSDQSGVIPVVSMGVTDAKYEESPQRYLVTKMAHDGTLQDILNGHHDPNPGMIRQIAAGILPTVVAMHEHGIAHLDLKPENIAVEDAESLLDTEQQTDTATEALELIDFGIAEVIADEAPQEVIEKLGSLGIAGVIDELQARREQSSGTEGYMAPECFDPEQEITTKADVFAIGAILYQAASGEMPFRTSTGKEGEYKMSATTEAPATLRGLGLYEVPQEVSDIIRDTLRLDPRDRPSAEELESVLLAA